MGHSPEELDQFSRDQQEHEASEMVPRPLSHRIIIQTTGSPSMTAATSPRSLPISSAFIRRVRPIRPGTIPILPPRRRTGLWKMQ